ncbi:MAG: hypothetical protein WC408_01060 [Candidatus Micrarchaeia archaeon]|jgi:hypothetical protein
MVKKATKAAKKVKFTEPKKLSKPKAAVPPKKLIPPKGLSAPKAASPAKEEAFRPPAYSRGNFGMPKRMCPFCNSTDVNPDSMGGEIMSWTCKSCGNSFPAPLEVSGGKADCADEDSEYEEDEDLK